MDRAQPRGKSSGTNREKDAFYETSRKELLWTFIPPPWSLLGKRSRSIHGIYATSVGSHLKVDVATYSPIGTPLIFELPDSAKTLSLESEKKPRDPYEVPLMKSQPTNDKQ